MQCGADAKRAFAHFAAFEGKVLTIIANSLSEPLLLCAIKYLYDNELLNQKLK